MGARPVSFCQVRSSHQGLEAVVAGRTLRRPLDRVTGLAGPTTGVLSLAGFLGLKATAQGANHVVSDAGAWRPAAACHRAVNADALHSGELAPREVRGRERKKASVAWIALLPPTLIERIPLEAVAVGLYGDCARVGWLEIGRQVRWERISSVFTVAEVSAKGGIGILDGRGCYQCREDTVCKTESPL